jgi:hypothetical protein
MKKQFILGIFLVAFCACENLDLSQKIPNYTPMTVGNYWIYQHYRIDSLGVETKLSLFDSVAIIGDTTINNKKYIVSYVNDALMQGSYHLSFTRDSAGYLVDEVGNKLFTANNFTDTLKKFTYFYNGIKIYNSSAKMEKHEGLITVPAGNFEVLNVKETIKILARHNDKGEWESLNTIEYPVIYNNTYYTPNIGKILDTYQYLSDYNRNQYEKRLIRYKIY